jgi:hypothetical protein
MRLILKFCVEKNIDYLNFPTSYGRYTKKSVLPFLVPLKWLDCTSRVRLHFEIPFFYRNGIGGILNVSFCNLCLFWKTKCIKQNSTSCPNYEKSCFLRICTWFGSGLWKRSDVINFHLHKFALKRWEIIALSLFISLYLFIFLSLFLCLSFSLSLSLALALENDFFSRAREREREKKR